MDFVFWIIFRDPFEEVDFEGLPILSVTGVDQVDRIVADFVFWNAPRNSESSRGDGGGDKKDHHEKQQAAESCRHPTRAYII